MIFAGWEVRIVKNRDQGLENALSVVANHSKSNLFTIN